GAFRTRPSISNGTAGASRWWTSTDRGSTSCCCAAPPSSRRTAMPAAMPERGLRALLDGFRAGDPDELLTLEHLLGGLGRRAFGMLLFVAILPAFIPIPVGGAVSGRARRPALRLAPLAALPPPAVGWRAARGAQWTVACAPGRPTPCVQGCAPHPPASSTPRPPSAAI